MKCFAVFFIGLLMMPAFSVFAYYAQRFEPERPSDLRIIEDPEHKRAYYGELTGAPHTYTFTTSEPFTLELQILVPDVEAVRQDIRGIVVREMERGVEEITRLHPEDANWEAWHEPWGNDTYRVGPLYQGTLDAGTYRIEVSNADNEGKYVMRIGRDADDDRSYFEKVSAVMEMKQFFGRPALSSVVSPLVYIPLSVIIILTVSIVFFLKKRRAREAQVI